MLLKKSFWESRSITWAKAHRVFSAVYGMTKQAAEKLKMQGFAVNPNASKIA
jgi:hypothetical protein